MPASSSKRMAPQVGLELEALSGREREARELAETEQREAEP